MIRALLPHPLLTLGLFATWLLLSGSVSAGDVLVAVMAALAIPQVMRRLEPDRSGVRSPGDPPKDPLPPKPPSLASKRLATTGRGAGPGHHPSGEPTGRDLLRRAPATAHTLVIPVERRDDYLSRRYTGLVPH